MLTKTGRCHCGNLRYTFTFPDLASLPARACGCSYCVRHGGVYTSHPDATLNVVFEQADHVARYRFGHETAEFIFCRECGVLVLAVCEIDGRLRAVLNINTFEHDSGPPFDRTNTDFDGETVEGRLDRRRRNWIGTVAISPA